MKKFIKSALIFVLILSFAVSASALTRGTLSKLNIDEDDFTNFLRKTLGQENGGDVVVFYDSILSMVLSLGAGDIFVAVINSFGAVVSNVTVSLYEGILNKELYNS